jgi:vancomycin resistance protein YoaR
MDPLGLRLQVLEAGALKLPLFALAALWLAPALGARELARFSCQRPEPFEAGAAANAAVACGLIDGKIVLPGEQFSFNRSMTKGLARFVDATAYSNGRVLRSNGGGVCQVTAALYNAALVAGLPVLERYSHSVYDPLSAYVAPGLDCAISRTNGADFRFSNTGAAPLTISAKAEGGRVEVVFYGEDPDPRSRWVVTQELERHKHRVIVRQAPGLAPGQRKLLQKGFDGLRLRRQLCTAGPAGLTECAALAPDEYMLMNEIWEEGPREAER